VATAKDDSEGHRAALATKARPRRGMHADRSFAGKRCLIALPFTCLRVSLCNTRHLSVGCDYRRP
jgi:hypothetical protein